MNEKKIDKGALASGFILIAIGVTFLVIRFTDLDLHELVRNYWPMVLVVIGLPKLFSYKTLWSGLWLIAIGVWMQGITLGTFGMTWSNSWPLLLIVLGLGTIGRTLLDVVMHEEADHER